MQTPYDFAPPHTRRRAAAPDDAHAAPPDAASDDALAAGVRSGDGASFEALFRRYYAPLHAFARGYVGTAEAAEDVVHDVFLRIWARRDAWVVRASVKSYLYAAIRNHALDDRRRRRPEVEWCEPAGPTDDGDDVAPLHASADAALLTSETHDAVECAVAALPGRTRRTFLLSREHGLTYGEIAAVMNVSVKTVETQIGRALKALRAALAGHAP